MSNITEDRINELREEYNKISNNTTPESTPDIEALKKAYEKTINKVEDKKEIKADEDLHPYLIETETGIQQLFISENEIASSYYICGLSSDNIIYVHNTETIFTTLISAVNLVKARPYLNKYYTLDPTETEEYEEDGGCNNINFYGEYFKRELEISSNIYEDKYYNKFRYRYFTCINYDDDTFIVCKQYSDYSRYYEEYGGSLELLFISDVEPIIVDNKIYFLTTDLISNGYKLDSNGNWVKPIEIHDITTVNNYDLLKSCLEGIYGDNWDIINNSSFREIQVNNLGAFKNTTYSIFIKFPEITITNSSKEFHTIRDLFVVIPLTLENNTFYIRSSMYGFRLTLNESEYSSYYIHSHLPTGSSPENISTFCLGSGSIVQMLNRLRTDGIQKLNFTAVLATIYHYVRWESLEGGPHIKISSIINRSQEIPFSKEDPMHLRGFYNQEITTIIKNLRIRPILINNSVDYNFEDLENLLTELLMPTGNYTTVLKDCNLNKYYKIVTNVLEENIIRQLPVKFRGENLVVNIEKNKSLDLSNCKKVIHPYNTNHVRKKLIERINSYFFEKERNNQIRKAYSKN